MGVASYPSAIGRLPSVPAMTAAGGAALHPIVEFMASQPGVVDRLLAGHGDDGTGHCKTCSAGPQAGRRVWPCTLHVYAKQAQAARS